jgi:hypothetical protein
MIKASTFAKLLIRCPLRCHTVYMSPQDAKEILGSLPWSLEEIPSHCMVQVLDGKLALVAVEESDAEA